MVGGRISRLPFFFFRWYDLYSSSVQSFDILPRKKILGVTTEVSLFSNSVLTKWPPTCAQGLFSKGCPGPRANQGSLGLRLFSLTTAMPKTTRPNLMDNFTYFSAQSLHLKYAPKVFLTA